MSDGSFHIVAINGSLRRMSFNRGLLHAAGEMLPEGVTIEIVELHDIPMYNGDVEAEGVPAAVQALAGRVRAADALIFSTPEYNFSFSGVLKNAIDWLSRPPSGFPMRHKPAALMGATGGLWGTVRAQLHLRQVLSPLEVYVLPRPEVLVANARERFDADANLVDEVTRQMIGAQMIALVEWARRVRLEAV